MKIDVLTTNLNINKESEIKINGSSGDFLSLLDNCIEGVNIEEDLKNSNEKEENLNALTEAILRYLNIYITQPNEEMSFISNFNKIQEETPYSKPNSLDMVNSFYEKDDLLSLLKNFISKEEAVQLDGLLEKIISKNFEKADLKDLFFGYRKADTKKIQELNIKNEDMFFRNNSMKNNVISDLELFKEKISFINYNGSSFKEDEVDILNSTKKIDSKEIFNEREIHHYSSEFGILKEIAYSNLDRDKNIKNFQPLLVRQQYIIEDIFKATQYIVKKNIKELNVKMSPKDLGDMNIRFIKSDEENKFIITLNKKDVLGLLKENLNDIKTYLTELNGSTKQVSVEIRSENQSEFSQNLNQQFHEENPKKRREEKVSNLGANGEEKVLGLDEEINLLI